MTYEELGKVNSQIKGTDIKGKNYAEVNQRIKAFRKLYPNGCIATELLSNDNGVCVMQTKVYDEDGKLLATGMAYEKENSTFINKTSYIENCETSACGRALGMLGIGIDVSIASYEEVTNAMVNQEPPKAITSPPQRRASNKAPASDLNRKIDENMLTVLKASMDTAGVTGTRFNNTPLEELTVEQYHEAMKQLQKMEGKKKQ